MAQLNLKLPETPNLEWQEVQFPFNGQWMPSQDPTLIGPENFSVLTNMRYNDISIEGVSGYEIVNSTPIAGYTDISNGFQLRTTKTNQSFTLVHAINPTTGRGRVYQNKTTPGSTGDFDTTSKIDSSGNAYKEDVSVNLKGRFSAAPQNSVVYCNGEESYIYSGDEHRVAAVFQQYDDSTAYILDASDAIKSTLTTSYITVPNSSFDELIILTTRPVQGFKFYVETANAVAGAMTVTYWDGDSWAAIANGSDGTDDGGATLAQTGTYSFDHTLGVAKLKHYNELYLFAYKVTLAAGVGANIYHITCDAGFIPVQNVWDGVYRQPIQFQFDNAGALEDYTLQVNASSDLNYPVGGQLDGMLATDEVYIMFEEQVAGIKLVMLGGLVNKNASVLTVKYWDGNSWEAVTDQVDGTSVGGTKTLGQTGLISWTPESDEQKQTLFGSLGYAYQLTVGDTLTGTKGSTEEVLIDLCYGIPNVSSVSACDFSAMYKNRLMLCGFSAEGEGNRMDYCAPNAPDVYNGSQTSNNKFNSIYFGGNEPILGATQLFNRFGASIFSMLLIHKSTETYIFVGNDPTDFEVYPVSMTVGCPAPLTICTTEVSLEGEGNYARNFVIWLSHYGPVMFDGAVIVPIKGVEHYFDPVKTECIDWSMAYKSRAWIDPINKEWNLLIPSGSGSTDVNVWLCYDITRRKWFRKDTAAALLPLCGFTLMNPSTGEQMSYGGLNDGTIAHLEEGTSWNSTGIAQRVKPGDFFLSKNIWDLTLIRKLKVLTNKVISDASVYLDINYYNNTDIDPGQSVIFTDGDVVFTDGDVIWSSAITATQLLVNSDTYRVIRKIIDMNALGFCHSFSFEVTTSDVIGGFRPLFWGIRYRIERKDDTAT